MYDLILDKRLAWVASGDEGGCRMRRKFCNFLLILSTIRKLLFLSFAPDMEPPKSKREELMNMKY